MLFVVVVGAIKKVLGYGQLPNFIFSSDCESKFLNKTELDTESFERCFIDGTRFIAQELEAYDYSGCFFINISEYLNGTVDVQARLESLIKSIHDNGHQLGIHIHPSLHSGFESTDFSSYSVAQMTEMLHEAKNVFKAITGETPIVFRAGGYSAGNWAKLYEALIASEIFIDSSIFPGAQNLHGAKFDFSAVEFHQPYRPHAQNFWEEDPIGMITEYPITSLRKPKHNLAASVMRFDPNRPLWQLKAMINYLRSSEPKLVNFIYHSKEVFRSNGDLDHSAQNLTAILRYMKESKMESSSYE